MDIHRLTDAIGDRSIAVVIPSYNAGLSIAAVVIGFQKALPGADIIVFDNGSDDNTAHMARAAGARIVHEPRRGKTDVITRIFRDVDSDLVVMASADGAHDPALAPTLVGELIRTGSDMAVGVRENFSTNSGALANRLFQALLGPTFTDIFSSYRVFTRRFMKSFPATAPRLDILAEMSMHANALRMPTCEVIMEDEPAGEGLAAIPQSGADPVPTCWTFLKAFEAMRPARFYAVIAAIITGAGLALSAPTLPEIVTPGEADGAATQLLATTIVSTGTILAALLVCLCGLILDGIRRFAIEQRRMTYLSLAGFGPAANPVDSRISESRGNIDDPVRPRTIHHRDFPASANAA